jgi:hypothetical protein
VLTAELLRRFAGSMRFPAGPANPTEGLAGVVLLLLATALLGPQLWITPRFSLLGRDWSLGEVQSGASFLHLTLLADGGGVCICSGRSLSVGRSGGCGAAVSREQSVSPSQRAGCGASGAAAVAGLGSAAAAVDRRVPRCVFNCV